MNTNIYFYLETSGGQSFNLYLNVVHFLNTSVNNIYVATSDSCFSALVSIVCFSIGKDIKMIFYLVTSGANVLKTFDLPSDDNG